MSHNRIARFRSNEQYAFPQTAPAKAASHTVAGAMILVPVMAQQAAWQSQLYQLAYERALADLARPRYLDRFFSVWN